jgi:TRAP-type mannitol/chloroaromatic compound transport system permease small subunit
MIKRSLNFIDNLSKWSGLIVAPLVLVYMAVLIYEMVSRYAFGAPTLWAHEISTFLFGAQFMLGGAYCFLIGSMVNVELFLTPLSKRVRAIINVLLFIIPLVVLVAMIWRGGWLFVDSIKMLEHSASIFAPPLYPVRGVIPVAAFLFLLQVVARLIRDLHIAITGKELQ